MPLTRQPFVSLAAEDGSDTAMMTSPRERTTTQNSTTLYIHSEVTIFYFFKCRSCILGRAVGWVGCRVGWAVVSTILNNTWVILQHWTNTKSSCVTSSDNKIINRAINKKEGENEEERESGRGRERDEQEEIKSKRNNRDKKNGRGKNKTTKTEKN